ncbi:MAG: hypothetical protein DWQ47_12775 [Acidobacteria bacterium]|nr:MAG: hypothetical protein DWQ32_00175 [Acidobacteriota bacterium]REK03042.1 MAG: hypothetical protein DWQ38_11960 [Acidobacteriota bacterium]REK13154.1 MAG: hypothetical protein DWQ43_05865 [Acidobacteriota bacterium]REK41148.1 MAG: hypothetical protein DWQ47_12775 [Acidobacteriota bacterium]
MGNIQLDDPEDNGGSQENIGKAIETPDDPASPKIQREKKMSWAEWLETDRAINQVYLVFGLIVIGLLMFTLQFSTGAVCCGDWDGYYHIRWSALLWESLSQFKGLPQFTWLPLTVLNAEGYADHHFLFHLLQIPFLWFFEPVTAAKVAAVFYGTLAIFSVYWLMFRYKVGYLLIWLAALLTCANPFWYRMNMAKAPPLTIIYTVVGIYLLFERKYFWLMPLMFVFVWTYSLFPLLFAAAVIWVAVIAWNERVFEWKPLAYTLAGMVLGNVINPYFPNNILLFTEHFLTKVRSSYEVAVGGEWYPYTSWQLITHLAIALIAMLVGYILYKSKGGRLPERSTFFLIFATLLLVWMFKSKRLAEYFPPFAILFAAFSWQAFRQPEAVELPEEFQRDIKPLLDTEARKPEPKGFVAWSQWLAPWIIGGALVLWLFFNFFGSSLPFEYLHKIEDLRSSVRSNEPNDKYSVAMEWAKKNIPPGERILNSNWDDFPKLFFFNTQNEYVWGLDPNYLYSENPEVFRVLKDVTDGKVDDPAPLIKEKIGARWVFADAEQNESFLAKLLESGWADIVHEDGEAYILKIRDQRGEPAAPEPVSVPTRQEVIDSAEGPQPEGAGDSPDAGSDEATEGEEVADPPS